MAAMIVAENDGPTALKCFGKNELEPLSTRDYSAAADG